MVERCRLQKAGWVSVDADGFLCNGPYTRPDNGGLPKEPTRLVKKSCRTCAHASVQHGAIVCYQWVPEDSRSAIPILDALEHCTDARTKWSTRMPAPPLFIFQGSLFDEGDAAGEGLGDAAGEGLGDAAGEGPGRPGRRRRPRRQCKDCPWKVATNPHDIPNGYCERKHRALESTIANPGIPNVIGSVRVMACHETPVGRELPCVGWMAQQLGPGNNIALRVAVADGVLDANFELDGEQHMSLADTFPT
jgi:hypothetical protein